jgi:hypothetical protein
MVNELYALVGTPCLAFVQKTPFRSRIIPFPAKQNINIAHHGPISSILEPLLVTPVVLFTTATQETTDAEITAAAPATHLVMLQPVTQSGPAAAGSSPAVDNPAVDNPAVDSPAVDSPAVDSPAADSPAADNPAAALHNPVAQTTVAADTLAQESLDTTARSEIGPSSPSRQRLGRFEPVRPHAASCGCGR